MATHQHVHQRISMPINIVTEAIEKENMRYQRELKIAISAISACASRMMRSKIKTVDTTNL